MDFKECYQCFTQCLPYIALYVWLWKPLTKFNIVYCFVVHIYRLSFFLVDIVCTFCNIVLSADVRRIRTLFKEFIFALFQIVVRNNSNGQNIYIYKAKYSDIFYTVYI